VITPFDVLPITRDDAQADARRELSKGIYHRYDDPWPVRAFKAVAHWLDHLFNTVADNAPGGGAGAFGLVVALLVLLAVARWQLGPVRRRTPGMPAGPVLGDRIRSAADHRQAAAQAAAAGDWVTAVTERMRAIARDLEERGLVDPRPARTADELAAEVATLLPEAADKVRAAATTFDAVVYGGRSAERSSYDVVVAADESVRERRPALLGRSR
jgi:hypothetical protein